MNLFSQRQGLKPIKKIMQIDDMDEDLRNSLWNALTIIYWRDANKNLMYRNKIDILIDRLWTNYFKIPIDNLSDYWSDTKQEIRDYFFSCEWYEVYDFIEFVANNYPEESVNSIFMDFCNSVLERELSAYRFIEGKITPITEKVEIEEIVSAQQETKRLCHVLVMTAVALSRSCSVLLSLRKNIISQPTIVRAERTAQRLRKRMIPQEGLEPLCSSIKLRL